MLIRLMKPMKFWFENCLGGLLAMLVRWLCSYLAGLLWAARIDPGTSLMWVAMYAAVASAAMRSAGTWAPPNPRRPTEPNYLYRADPNL